jgi:hypothetical protein
MWGVSVYAVALAGPAVTHNIAHIVYAGLSSTIPKQPQRAAHSHDPSVKHLTPS